MGSSHWRRGGLVFLVVGIPTLMASFCVGPPGYYSAKYAPAGPAQPRAWPREVTPERQVEAHTCGLHSLASVYRAYGLDPENLRVRFRTGVDKPFSNFVPGSLGTIHPDMLRVLAQDGFRTELVHPGSSDAAKRLAAHLDRGQLAIALIRVNELHWVVLGAREGDEVVVCDSLREETYREPLQAYVRDRVYGLVLIAPR